MILILVAVANGMAAYFAVQTWPWLADSPAAITAMIGWSFAVGMLAGLVQDWLARRYGK